jgi:NAD(P)-dependent dehydrogenase (short-subunit alcohol dehydrogenase family)
MTRTGKVLVTGASSGIGRAVATALIARGWEVWGTSRDPARLADVSGLRPIALDLSSDASIDRALRAGLEEAGHFDVVINNAGNAIWGPLELLAPEQEKAQFQILVFGPMRIIRAVLPSMREQGRGLIVNVTSLTAQFVVPYLGAYSAAKAALASMTWSLQMELHKEPVRFVDLRPGDIRTDFNDVMGHTRDRQDAAYAKDAERAFAVCEADRHRAPSPEQVADMVIRILDRDGAGSPVIATGGLFQAYIAPVLARLVPTILLRWGMRYYYGLRR